MVSKKYECATELFCEGAKKGQMHKTVCTHRERNIEIYRGILSVRFYKAVHTSDPVLTISIIEETGACAPASFPF